jgi:ketosteroid isomerase-like protein
MSTAVESLSAAISKTNRAFEEAIARGDGAGAAAVYSSGGQALPPNGAIVSGRSGLQGFWQAVMDSGVKRVTLETLELTPCGDQAYEVGRATLYGAGGAALDTVKFIVVWQQEGGEWKWHRDIWNSVNPA